jgi:hypothetical protein
MTEPPPATGTDERPDWSWAITDISIEGTDTARVVCSAMSLPNEDGWSFKDQGRRYVRVWRFAYDSQRRRWRLSQWLNRAEYIEALRSNLLDPTDALLLREQPDFWNTF